jgi:hypothetical protein
METKFAFRKDLNYLFCIDFLSEDTSFSFSYDDCAEENIIINEFHQADDACAHNQTQPSADVSCC